MILRSRFSGETHVPLNLKGLGKCFPCIVVSGCRRTSPILSLQHFWNTLLWFNDGADAKVPQLLRHRTLLLFHWSGSGIYNIPVSVPKIVQVMERWGVRQQRVTLKELLSAWLCAMSWKSQGVVSILHPHLPCACWHWKQTAHEFWCQWEEQDISCPQKSRPLGNLSSGKRCWDTLRHGQSVEGHLTAPAVALAKC